MYVISLSTCSLFPIFNCSFYVLGTCTLPAGCSLVAPIYHLHRDPRFWSNPDGFDPERFSPENVKKRNPNCYIPFSLGPMDCLGKLLLLFVFMLHKPLMAWLIQWLSKFPHRGDWGECKIPMHVPASQPNVTRRNTSPNPGAAVDGSH